LKKFLLSAPFFRGMHVLPAGLQGKGHQDALYASTWGVQSKFGATVIYKVKFHVSVNQEKNEKNSLTDLFEKQTTCFKIGGNVINQP